MLSEWGCLQGKQDPGGNKPKGAEFGIATREVDGEVECFPQYSLIQGRIRYGRDLLHPLSVVQLLSYRLYPESAFYEVIYSMLLIVMRPRHVMTLAKAVVTSLGPTPSQLCHAASSKSAELVRYTHACGSGRQPVMKLDTR